MISIVIPTRNRAHTLKIVAPSYFAQQGVTEIILVSDAGIDDTFDVVSEIARGFPHVEFKFFRNDERRGASLSRNIGVAQAQNEYILFVDDDEFLEQDYASVCLRKLLEKGAGAVSGRRIYMINDEVPADALRRFGIGLRNTPRFRPLLCEYINGATFSGDVEQPITNAIILTTRKLLQTYPYDGFYARGNGYREETDFQMNLFVHDYKIIVTNDVHSFHLPLSLVVTGGQRTTRLKKIYWSIFYTDYFFGKYYDTYSRKVGLKLPRKAAVAAFSVFALYREFIRPPIYRVAISLQKWHRQRVSR